jgi:hypothetical protein
MRPDEAFSFARITLMERPREEDEALAEGDSKDQRLAPASAEKITRKPVSPAAAAPAKPASQFWNTPVAPPKEVPKSAPVVPAKDDDASVPMVAA